MRVCAVLSCCAAHASFHQLPARLPRPISQRSSYCYAATLPPSTPLPCPASLLLPCAGALAGFAAATEFTFGSIVQRVMCWPGSVRFHYGHPDLWNKLWIMTRGGVSKATR